MQKTNKNSEKKGIFVVKIMKAMKKIKILFASVLFCVMGYTGYTAHEYATMSDAEKTMKANIEALTQDEGGGVNNPVGRWRTVGCGGRAFSQWKTYCCPADGWNNCQGKGNCYEQNIYDCYDPPRHLEVVINRFY